MYACVRMCVCDIPDIHRREFSVCDGPAVVAGVLGLGGQRVPHADDLLLPRLQPPDLRRCEGLVAHTLLHQAQECTHTFVLQPHTHQQLSANWRVTGPMLAR